MSAEIATEALVMQIFTESSMKSLIHEKGPDFAFLKPHWELFEALQPAKTHRPGTHGIHVKMRHPQPPWDLGRQLGVGAKGGNEIGSRLDLVLNDYF